MTNRERLHPAAPDDVIADPDLYARWRCEHYDDGWIPEGEDPDAAAYVNDLPPDESAPNFKTNGTWRTCRRTRSSARRCASGSGIQRWRA